MGFGLKTLENGHENEEKCQGHGDSLSWRTLEWILLRFGLEVSSPVPPVQCQPRGDRLLTESHYGLCSAARVHPVELTQVREASPSLYFPILQKALAQGSWRTEESRDSQPISPLSSCYPHGQALASPPLVPSVVLPPEKSEGHEGQLFSVDDGEKAANREGPLRLSKKHLNIDVSPLLCTLA